jgi:hypothetical protein
MDEFGIRFGPQEVSQKNHQASLEVRRTGGGRKTSWGEPSRGDLRWLKKMKAPAGCCSPSLLTARLAPLPTSIQFHEIFDTDLSVVTPPKTISQNTAGIV